MSKHLHRRLPLKIFLTLLLSASASAQSTQPEEKPADTIRGVVINSVTHEPVGRALVFSPDNRFGTMTNSEGQFEFTLAKNQTGQNEDGNSADHSAHSVSTCSADGCANYTSLNGEPYRIGTLLARKPGFLTDQTPVQSPQPYTTKELTISLIPEGLIVGRVVLPTSEPSDTIELELYRRQVQEGRAHWVRTAGASTKSNGEFRFADLAAGTYKLLTRELMDRDPLTFDPRGQLYGYPPVYFPNATDFAAAQTIHLTAGQIFQADLSLVRHEYYSVKVPVANVLENARGLAIVVSAQGHRGPGYALGYNYRTQTIEGLLPNGNYTLEASGFAPPSTGVVNISVKGAALDGPRMTLVPNGSISVNVKEEFTASEEAGSQGRAINGGPTGNLRGPTRYLNVRLEPADDFGQDRPLWLRPPAGPDDDSLIIDGVQPGRYWVRVDTSRGFVAAITSGTTDLQHQLLTVGPGGSSPPIEITMRDDTAELDGVIEGSPAQSEASPVLATRTATISADGSFAHVYCIPLPDSSGEFKDIWVSADGRFGAQPMPPGTYRVLAFDRPQPELEYRDPEAMRAYEAKGLLVRLVAGQKEHLQLPLISSTEISSTEQP
jgi:hypothetical protein